MNYWALKPGRYKELMQPFLDENMIAEDWKVEDSTSLTTRDAFKEAFHKSYPEKSDKQVEGMAGELYRFVCKIEIGDIVGVPDPIRINGRSHVHIGRVTGECQFKEVLGNRPPWHFRTIEWLKKCPEDNLTRSIWRVRGTLHDRNKKQKEIEEMLRELSK